MAESQNEKDILKENTILAQFPDNVQCVYYGLIDDISSSGEILVKFGNSNFLQDRVKRHKTTYTNFRLYNAFKVDNNKQTENAMKYHPILAKRRRIAKLNNVLHNELLAINDMNYEELDGVIKDIIQKIEYNPENYSRLLNENKNMKKQVHGFTKYKTTMKQQYYELLSKNELLIQKVQSLSKVGTSTVLENNVTFSIVDSTDENNNFQNMNDVPQFENVVGYNRNLKNSIIETEMMDCNETKPVKNKNVDFEMDMDMENDVDKNIGSPTSLRQFPKFERSPKRMKNKNGKYCIDGVEYKKLKGTRIEVWDNIAFTTKGKLIKEDFMVSNSSKTVDKIVSRRKHYQEIENYKFTEANQRRSLAKNNK